MYDKVRAYKVISIMKYTKLLAATNHAWEYFIDPSLYTANMTE